MGNSIKFTDEGMVVITSNLFPVSNFKDNHDFDVLEQDNKERILQLMERILQLMVHDTGIGISQNKQQDICEELGNFSSATPCKKLGLGLMFVR